MASTPNTLTNLIPTLYEAMDTVSRELVGFIPAVTRDSSAERAAKDQTINIPIVPAISASDIAPNVTAPDDGNATIGNTTMTISKSRYAPVRWNGEEQRHVGQTGMYNQVNRQRFEQAMRTLVNEVETDLAALHIYTSRAYGTFNTQPFGTAADLSDAAQVRKILEDNGSPTTDLQMVLSTTAIANLRGKQSVLFKLNEAGTDSLLRQGIIGNLEGFNLHSSAQVKSDVAVGTNNGAATVDTAAYAIGATTLTLASAGTGSILDGDIITLAGDTNKYIVKTGDASVAGGGTIVLQEPGLRVAIAGSAAPAITTIAATDRNMAFSRSAIALVTRAPIMPEGGDDADDVMEITDPISGLAFQIAMYRQYRQIRFEVGLAWGVKMIAPRHSALLIG